MYYILGSCRHGFSPKFPLIRFLLKQNGPYLFNRCVCYVNALKRYNSAPCSECDPYLIKFESEDAFWERFKKLIGSESSNFCGYKNSVRDLLILTSPKGRLETEDIPAGAGMARISDAYAVRHAQFVNLPAKTVLFWSPDQYEVLQRKFVVLRSGTENALPTNLSFEAVKID